MAEEPSDKKDVFDFDNQGEALGYISLTQARVLAMQTARETPGEYGRRYRNAPMAFEVAESNEDEDFYNVTLSFRPQGQFSGAPGQEQFFIEKEGSVAHRQVLSSPIGTGGRSFPLIPIAVGVLIFGATAVGGTVLVSGGLTENIFGGVQIPALQPTLTPIPTIPTTSAATATAMPQLGLTPTSFPIPTSTSTTGRTPLPTSSTPPPPTPMPVPPTPSSTATFIPTATPTRTAVPPTPTARVIIVTPTPRPSPSPTPLHGNDGAIVSISNPDFPPGASRTITVVSRNTGTSTTHFRVWTDSISSGWKTSKECFRDRGDTCEILNVSPGGTFSFDFRVIAPASGTTTAIWRLKAAHTCGVFGCRWDQEVDSRSQSFSVR